MCYEFQVRPPAKAWLWTIMGQLLKYFLSPQCPRLQPELGMAKPAGSGQLSPTAASSNPVPPITVSPTTALPIIASPTVPSPAAVPPTVLHPWQRHQPVSPAATPPRQHPASPSPTPPADARPLPSPPRPTQPRHPAAAPTPAHTVVAQPHGPASVAAPPARRRRPALRLRSKWRPPPPPASAGRSGPPPRCSLWYRATILFEGGVTSGRGGHLCCGWREYFCLVQCVRGAGVREDGPEPGPSPRRTGTSFIAFFLRERIPHATPHPAELFEPFPIAPTPQGEEGDVQQPPSLGLRGQ